MAISVPLILIFDALMYDGFILRSESRRVIFGRRVQLEIQMTRRSEGKGSCATHHRNSPPCARRFELEVKPKGIVEQIYVDDIATIVWEIRRLAVAKFRSQQRLPCRLAKSSQEMMRSGHLQINPEADGLAI
jgi:hypothetical protein